MKNKYLTIPNLITSLRIAGTICLLFIPPLTPIFLMLYTFTGITDVLDGLIARITRTTSEFGAKLDSIADLLFYTVMLIRIFPVMWIRLPVEIWYAVGAILVLRLLAYLVAAIRYRRFASLHTYMNKLTGAAVFCVPYVISQSLAVPACWGVCGIAAASSVEELLIHICGKEYISNTKTLAGAIISKRRVK